MMRRVLTILGLIALTFGVLWACSKVVPECDSDDGGEVAVCVWDAQSQGNTKGTSFIFINGLVIPRP